jgi:glycolate oxidase
MEKILKELSRKFQEEFFLNESIRIAYSFDTSFLYSIPKAVFIPKDKNKLIDITLFLLKKNIPVTPRGKATGRSGGCIPHPESVLISTERLKNKIFFDVENEILTCEPGFTIDEINEFLKGYGYFYPPDPASSDIASIGGTVATNAGGPKAFRYGITINYVQELEVILGDGSVIKLGRKVKKDEMFFHLKELFVGSEGNLGIISEISLRCLPLKKYRKTLLLKFKNFDYLFDFSEKIIKKENLTLCELMGFEKDALLWLEFESEERKEVEREIEYIKSYKKRNFELQIPETEEEEREILFLRRKFSSLQWKITGRRKGIDITVPLSKIREVFKFYKKLEKNKKIKIIPYGHFGDGNIHTSIIFKKGEEEKAENTRNEICEYVLDIGGTITGEHGIGIKYLEYTKKFKKHYSLMLKIKEIFDPFDLINRGKLKGEINPQKYHPGEGENMCVLCSLCNKYSSSYKKYLREDKAPRGEIFISKLKKKNYLSSKNKKTLKYCPIDFKNP